MFLIRWARTLLALPFVTAGRLAGTFKLPAAVPLLKIGYAVGDNYEVALQALSLLFTTYGPQVAHAQGRAWLERRRCGAAIAGFTGLTALTAEDVDEARALLDLGRGCGEDPTGMTDLLAMGLAARSGDPRDVSNIIHALQQRNDLPPMLSRMVLSERMENALARRDFAEARALAMRMLDIEESPSARVILWACERKEGRSLTADEHLAAAVNLPPWHYWYLRAEGEFALDNPQGLEEARRKVYEENEKMGQHFDRFLALQGQTA